jgi:DNA polymerase III epsilon subunit-like protein
MGMRGPNTATNKGENRDDAIAHNIPFSSSFLPLAREDFRQEWVMGVVQCDA